MGFFLIDKIDVFTRKAIDKSNIFSILMSQLSHKNWERIADDK